MSFTDGGADEWIDEADCGQDIVEDWDAGLEYAVAKEIVDVVQVGTERRFKVCGAGGLCMAGLLDHCGGR